MQYTWKMFAKANLYLFIIVVLSYAFARAGMVVVNDDDPIQYITVPTNTRTNVPAGAELHLFSMADGNAAFTDVGAIVFDSEYVVFINTTLNGISNDTLYVQVPDTTYGNNTYTLYTQYKLSSVLGDNWGLPATDSVRVHWVMPIIPPGETITITVDK